MAAPVFVIGGATASGKSALALELALKCNGEVVNFDSVQLYAELPTLTARPSPADEAAVPHRLYGLFPADFAVSAARYADLAELALGQAAASGRPVFLVGGTGLYLEALAQGVAPVPAIAPEVRDAVRAMPPMELRRRLAEADPEAAAKLAANDAQRAARALEVVLATGRTLARWQEDGRLRKRARKLAGVALLPERAASRLKIHERTRAMLEAGAVEEVAGVLERYGRRGLDPLGLPIKKAHGYRELAAYLQGRMSLDEAEARTTLQVQRYAKRQSTYFRNRLAWLEPIEAFGDGNEALERAAAALEAVRPP